MKKLLIVLLVMLWSGIASAASYNYVEPDTFKQWLESDKGMNVVDIQVAGEFAQHHFKNSIETNAYPVETDAQRTMIDKALEAFRQNGQEIVVVCPRGGGGAKRCYDYLKENGVPDDKLLILKGGVEKWPYEELLEKSAGN